MDVKHSKLESLLRLPGADPPGTIVADAAVLTCGCLVSEMQFLSSGTKQCPVCGTEGEILKAIAPLRELYKLLDPKSRRTSSSRHSLRKPSVESTHGGQAELDLSGLFCKLAREENEEKTREKEASSSPEVTKTPSLGQMGPPVAQAVEEQELEKNMLLGLNEQEEYNFSRCFPFHRKLTTFQASTNRFRKLSLRSSIKSSRYNGSSLHTWYDKATGEEHTSFVLITDKRWELYTYTPSQGKPALLACGKSTGEYSYRSAEFRLPSEREITVKNDFGGKSATNDLNESVSSKLKSWVHLSCCLSGRFLILSGTRGVVRVLNADPAFGDVGAPVYTYLTNFPIRCVSVAPKENLVACGITARERMSGKQQPFIILHQLEMDPSSQKVKSVHPITITIPYRDPLKVISFNASSTHLICSTVYEMRYFIIRLRPTPTSICKKPMLIWSDMRVASRQKLDEMPGDRSYDTNLDDQVMDSEGITDIKFGLPGTNTIGITTSSWNNRPSLLVKLEGPSMDSLGGSTSNISTDLLNEDEEEVQDDRGMQITDYDIILKVPEIGSSIYRVQFSPRGDSILFVDKSGRIFLVSTPNARTSTRSQTKKIIVLLGEAANAVRPNEAASASYSSDGGKIYVVDRRGLFQVFDFTKGIPGEDPEVIKCKIVSV
ncbi:hypothetical protein FT663_00568 [Candidozyma haemuli var. vulneris]|uniref:Uncharacterized protein n=1 Tax=Candidozyma haemuli TaxID=45357 RepID=A0A2V1B194_9ASCO|nr:hypothetical protein CXQ85_004042 [[Candida] haemuloni]KAF3993294.1 hypothetical protein FT662_00674 [[Candida] haemuloni var. vulneris]KAF3995350.1 hypothetical protein FT663_00568 [[Candida] haemuloni var. vulneris]PVH23749.1 hypothetical protein CXQ85_004042 [[Candida] haemuloni]